MVDLVRGVAGVRGGVGGAGTLHGADTKMENSTACCGVAGACLVVRADKNPRQFSIERLSLGEMCVLKTLYS